MNRSRKGGSVSFSKILEESILELLSHNSKKQFNLKQIAAKIGDAGRDINQIRDAVLSLIASKKIKETDQGKFKISHGSQKGSLTGKLELTQSGDGYVISEHTSSDTLIREKNLKTAMHGDIVRFHVFPDRNGRKPEGEIIEVLERARTEFVGTVKLSEFFAFLVPDSRKGVDIYIPGDSLNNVKNGEKAIAEIVEWTEGKSPTGRITKVLGRAGENDTEMHAILAEYELPYEFPEEVENAANKFPMEIAEEEIKKRRDFRDVLTFTIDPVDAKDFDDALSIRPAGDKDGEQLWEIGVHIADVSHYVTPGSILDLEAIERATSVYLVDRVVPMLPEHLSNGVCSLRPNEEKLTFSAVFKMDINGKIYDEWYGRTIINSNRRFAYEQAQEIIEGKEDELSQEIIIMDKMAKNMRKDRFRKGSIGFEKVEVKFHLDEKGNPTGVYFKESKDANKLIEEFMLLANRKVAELVSGKQDTSQPNVRPYVYRIHDKPGEEKLAEFSAFIGKFGYRINAASPATISKSLNSLMEEIKGRKEENVIETLAIRTMAKAVYSSQNIGHYGLGFEFYTHFTSPIRRYPDILAHRILQDHLDKAPYYDEETLEELCRQSSDMEKRASDAERASIKYKQVQFMQDKLGRPFKAVISGVTEFGMFVEIIENRCEGLVRTKDLMDDQYFFDEDNYQLTGRRTGNSYRLGDEVTVEVKKADLIRKQLDFLLVEVDEEGNAIPDEDRFGSTKNQRSNTWPGDKKKSSANINDLDFSGDTYVPRTPRSGFSESSRPEGRSKRSGSGRPGTSKKASPFEGQTPRSSKSSRPKKKGR